MWGFGWIEVSLTIIFNDVLWNNSSQVGMAIGIKKGEKWRPICKLLFVIVFFSAKDSICLHKCTLIYNLFFLHKMNQNLDFLLSSISQKFSISVYTEFLVLFMKAVQHAIVWLSHTLYNHLNYALSSYYTWCDFVKLEFLY